MNKTIEHLVIGYGEVGKAIAKVFDAFSADKDSNYNDMSFNVEYLHICFPYSEEFVSEVKAYQQRFKPTYTIIHSTVPVTTSRKVGAIHSPIRGIHPNLYEGIMTFEKFLGGEDASMVADEFRKHGLKVILFDTQEATELGKLLDTEYYRACIEFTLRAKEHCDRLGLSFHEVYTLFNETYNKGYAKLDHPEYVRPVLQPIMKEIGGHCVIPNSKLINKL